MTTGIVAVGATCPHVSDTAAVVTQSLRKRLTGRTSDYGLRTVRKHVSQAEEFVNIDPDSPTVVSKHKRSTRL
ncbi:hypothetical protein ACFFQF_27810 [Haladaptatus pallidirubidus]|uniref:hypothetical protein n=1 Tax=Haladaptatus pallidirubidus TaxID=1008152 RepID=UPI001D105B56|nr:hypothetical protein [Haladaptatus pallidirubidus]